MKKLTIAALLLTGCTTRHAVFVTTGSVLGLDISENPSTSLYHVKFGYVRSEFAYIPSNRSSSTNDPTTGQGAKDVASVLMELKMQNIFQGGGIYQRLAIGEAAVSQPGAAFMFAKDSTGNFAPGTAEAVAQSLQSIPVLNAAATAAKVPLAAAYRQSGNKTAFDAVAKAKGYESFAAFLTSSTTTAADVRAVADALKAANINVP